jgi:hypothetical protein
LGVSWAKTTSISCNRPAIREVGICVRRERVAQIGHQGRKPSNAASRMRGCWHACGRSAVAESRDGGKISGLSEAPILGRNHSEMACYGSRLDCPKGNFLLYNGNAYGKDGFGAAPIG